LQEETWGLVCSIGNTAYGSHSTHVEPKPVDSTQLERLAIRANEPTLAIKRQELSRRGAAWKGDGVAAGGDAAAV
jgi:hypothetical protein